ncbi:transposase, partial [Cupriavidus sp. AcVe19-6a]|uniref:transposase n=1 Tax=Cupriavidus sp. AcVe19-6a TaxID=2821358 RepID=UPI00352BDD9C
RPLTTTRPCCLGISRHPLFSRTRIRPQEALLVDRLPSSFTTANSTSVPLLRQNPQNAVYLALGVLPDGTHDILGLWIESIEGGKFRMKLFNDLKTRRGTQDSH